MVTMARDILNDSLAVLRIDEHDDEENWPLEDKPCKTTGRNLSSIPLNSQLSLTKDDCACYYNYAHGDSGGNRQHNPIYQYKTSSLPAASSINQNWDDIVRSALRLTPEDIGNQLTLLDLPCFKSIKPEELTTCGWTKLNKFTIAPNVVAFTKRFNRVSFWTVQEILNGQSTKARAEILAHFIKVAKKLHELNNLHSLFAVVSALNSASIYRLTKTWACLPKKDKQQFDKLAELFGERDNWTALREYLRSVPLPCIPYLGIFLTDLVYIDIAHPAGSPHRATKMNVVLKALERYQTSEYEMAPLPHVANFLNSVRYIEELQKFLEDDQYKLSLKLEPPSPVGSCSGSKESVREVAALTASPPHKAHKAPQPQPPAGSCHQTNFIPTHRKSRSLGSNIFGKSHTDEKMGEKTPAGSVNLLDDTLLESPASALGAHLVPQIITHSDPSKTEEIQCEFEGCIRRKTILKDGRKVSLSSWQRYWVQISGNVLFFYAAKSFKGTSRGDFRLERCKALPLEGWAGHRLDGDRSDAFQLINSQTATVYKLKAGSECAAEQWLARIGEVTNKTVKPLPANLMSFE